MPTDDDYDDDDRPRRRPARDDDDRPARGSAMPGGAKAAGFIWIGYGSLGILLNLVGIIMSAAQGQVGGNICGTVISLLIAGAFLFVGVQTVKGTAPSMMGNGIGSLILGVLQLGCGGIILAGGGVMAAGGNKANMPAEAGFLGTVMMILGGAAILFGLSLITAGILGLMNNTAYLDWQAANGLGKRRKRKVEEEDYDDRPRRRRRDEDDDDDRPRRPRRDDD